jgi:hypothetical protein
VNAELMRQHQAKKERAARFARSVVKRLRDAVALDQPTAQPPVEPVITANLVAIWIEKQWEIPLPVGRREVQPFLPAYPPVDKIQKVVARRFGVTRMDIMSRRKMARLVLPRHVAIYLTKELTPLSLPQIGMRFGGKDHTTILHAVRRMEKIIADDSKIAEIVHELRSQVAA